VVATGKGTQGLASYRALPRGRGSAREKLLIKSRAYEEEEI
jgi:hypothetical protein